MMKALAMASLVVILIALFGCLAFMLATAKQTWDEMQDPVPPPEKPQKAWMDITIRDLRSFCIPFKDCENCPVGFLCATIFRVKPDDWILYFEEYRQETENLLKAINSKRDWGPDPIATWLLEACQRVIDRGPLDGTAGKTDMQSEDGETRIDLDTGKENSICRGAADYGDE